MSVAAPAVRLPAATARPLLAAPAARLAGFAGLASFGALHWAMLVAPRESGRMLLAVAVALAAGAAMGRVERFGGPGPHFAPLIFGLGSLALALMAVGIPARLLLPGGWGELGAGVTQGLEALPDVRVPYAGVDDWPRLTILAGGAALVAIAAAAAFWPARRGRGAGQGIGLFALTALFAIPVVDMTVDAQFLRGAAFAALVAAYLWLERVPRTGAAGAAVALTAALAAGLAAAPAIDGRGPWVDYERIAESLAPAASVRFDFSHEYGPIDWPRDGREMLRIHARGSTYWKAENVDEFDGRRWRAATTLAGARTPLSDELPAAFASRRRWRERIEVTVRGLEGRDAVAAGTTLRVLGPPSAAIATASPGTFAFEEVLERGDSYAVEVYVPRPSPRELARAGTGYPQLSPTYWTLGIRTTQRAQAAGLPFQADVRFAPFASGGSPTVALDEPGALAYGDDASEILRRSEYARSWALAQRLAARSRSPYEYARRILAYLGTGFGYSETPSRHAVPLEAFLFDDKIGYCQHFSGAMALLLRMGGVPARVVGGFSPGSYSPKRRDYVVRDIDAHSWVEAYFPGYGWVTFDPTPAASPARSQLVNIDLPNLDAPAGAGAGELAQRGDVPEPGPRTARGAGGQSGDGGSGLVAPALLGLLAIAVAGGLALGVARLRRRADPPGDSHLAELERALRRTGRPVLPGATLAQLEERLRLDSAAAGYLRALRERRYGFGGTPPTPGQRRELRRALARGLGPVGRLRALWALPPRLGASARGLH
jgi:transglutaminase superfamily protein